MSKYEYKDGRITADGILVSETFAEFGDDEGYDEVRKDFTLLLNVASLLRRRPRIKIASLMAQIFALVQELS